MTSVSYKSDDGSSFLCVEHTDGLVGAGGERGVLNLWDASTQQLLHRYVDDDNDCTSLLFTKDGSLLFAAFDSKICQFDKRTFLNPVRTYNHNVEEINQLSINDRETFLASCDDSGETKVYSLQEGKVFKTLCHKHSNICSTVAFRPNHQWEVMTAGLDYKLIHWYFNKPKVVNEINMQELLEENLHEAQILNPPFIHRIAFSPNGLFLACALEKGIIKVFDCSRKHLRDRITLKGHNQGVSQVDFLSNRYLVSGGNDKQIIVWDLEKACGSVNAPNGAANAHLPPQQLNGHIANGHGSAHSNTVHHDNGIVVADSSGNNDAAANGDASHPHPHPQQHHQNNNNDMSDSKVFTSLLANKVNWLKCVANGNQNYVFIADESTSISRIVVDSL